MTDDEIKRLLENLRRYGDPTWYVQQEHVRRREAALRNELASLSTADIARANEIVTERQFAATSSTEPQHATPEAASVSNDSPSGAASSSAGTGKRKRGSTRTR